MATGAPPVRPPTPPPPPPLPRWSSSSSSSLMGSPSKFMAIKQAQKLYNNPDGSTTADAIQLESSLACQRLFNNEKFFGEFCHLVSYYHRVSSVLQEGPSCGLAALCMAAQLLNVKPVRTLAEVLEAARTLGLTCRGEMFSVANMCVLARELMSIQAEFLTDGLDQRRRIVEHLVSGKPVLVPYDADVNHEPSCRRGHKAHWAVLTGVVFIVPQECGIMQSRMSFVRDTSFPLLYHAKTDNPCLDWMDEESDKFKVYVYTRQGKSCHPSLWSYDELAKSNANLTELSPLRRRSIDGYVLPVDGIEGGLCRQIVFLSV